MILYFVQGDHSRLVHAHADFFALVIVDVDLIEIGDEIDVVQGVAVGTNVLQTLGGALVVVERHAGAQHIQHGRAFVVERRLDQRCELLAVARKAARDERRSHQKGQGNYIHRLPRVGASLAQPRAAVRHCGELAFGQAVHAIVLDDVGNAQIAAHHMSEVAQTDGGRVAVARNPDRDQRMVGQPAARGHRRHAAMNAVKAEGLVHEVVGGLGGTPDSAQLDHPLGVNVGLVGGRHDRSGDSIVAAPFAERRLRALVILLDQMQPIGRSLNLHRRFAHQLPPLISFTISPAVAGSPS